MLREECHEEQEEEEESDEAQEEEDEGGEGEHPAEEEDVEPAVMTKPAATAANDFQKSLDDFKGYVTKHKLEPKPDFSIFKH